MGTANPTEFRGIRLWSMCVTAFHESSWGSQGRASEGFKLGMRDHIHANMLQDLGECLDVSIHKVYLIISPSFPEVLGEEGSAVVYRVCWFCLLSLVRQINRKVDPFIQETGSWLIWLQVAGGMWAGQVCEQPKTALHGTLRQ